MDRVISNMLGFMHDTEYDQLAQPMEGEFNSNL
jgi:hypothetical protein